jgi:hypothetical protein
MLRADRDRKAIDENDRRVGMARSAVGLQARIPRQQRLAGRAGTRSLCRSHDSRLSASGDGSDKIRKMHESGKCKHWLRPRARALSFCVTLAMAFGSSSRPVWPLIAGPLPSIGSDAWTSIICTPGGLSSESVGIRVHASCTVAPASRVTETKTYCSTEKQGSQRESLGRGFEVASLSNTVQLFTPSEMTRFVVVGGGRNGDPFSEQQDYQYPYTLFSELVFQMAELACIK